MDENEFWALIDASRDQGDDQVDALTRLLTGRSREELAAFNRIYDGHLARAYRWEVWGAGYVINGGMSDDSFDDFCDWLIGQGRDVLERALADPDSLADLPQVVADLESRVPAEPAGEEWAEDADELRRLYPRLTAEFG